MVRRLSTTALSFTADFDALVTAARGATARVDSAVAEIIMQVRTQGDAALCALTERFDRVALTPETIRVGDEERAHAIAALPKNLKAALDFAARRIEAFHRAQCPVDLEMTDEAGVKLGMRWQPVDAVGLYVPGGKAAYPSSVLMNAIPARIAGVPRIAMCVPTPDGVLNPLVLAAADRAGVKEIYRVGGAQAIAALAFGTATIRPVDRIVGPGNAYVAEAKRQVFGRVGIDAIAGPSEVVIMAGVESDAKEVAIDLLAQAEHDENAQAILITNHQGLADAVARQLEVEVQRLPRAPIAAASLRDFGAIVLVENWDQGIELVNRIAPEHLEILIPSPESIFSQIRHAGAVFLGRFCPEAVGDYVAGPNHVLPTGGTARFASGLSVFDFLKRTNWMAVDDKALAVIGPAAYDLARAEGLDAHARSIAVRLERGAIP